MANQEIGQGVWYDAVNTGYIGLDVTAQIPPQKMCTAERIELFPKDEYHCSLVAVRKYVDPEEEQSVADVVKDYLREHDLRFAGLGDERYLCRKDDRATIVAPARIDGIDEFFGFIKKLIPDYAPPFIHVTLLKSETTEHGISVNSIEDLHQYCEELMNISKYGMHYDAANADIIARAQAVSDDKWETLPVTKLSERTPLNASYETVLRRHVDRVVSGDVPLRENYPTKLWEDDDGNLYIVDGHARTAIHYELNIPMLVRIMNEKSLAELGGQ